MEETRAERWYGMVGGLAGMIQWINPATGAVIVSKAEPSAGGDLVPETPHYYTDIVLKIDRVPDARHRSGLKAVEPHSR